MSTHLSDPWHDLDSALAGVIAALAVLRAGRALESDRQDLLAAARASAERLVRLIGELLAASDQRATVDDPGAVPGMPNSDAEV